MNQRPTVDHLLHHTFGLSAFRLGQQAVIDAILAGHSAFAIFPTGGGKSLCYQIPALLLPHVTVVVSPLLSLMKDQLDFLHRKNVPAARIDSTQSREQHRDIFDATAKGRLKILMVSVERFKNEYFREQLARIPLSLLVIEEAHCISEWGHNFRPEYLMLPEYQRQFSIPQVLLLTATANPETRRDVAQKFQIAPEHIIVTGFYRRNLHLDVQATEASDRLPALIELLAHSPTEPTIVYVTLQTTAEKIADQLAKAGIESVAYHAGLDAPSREDIQDRFMAGTLSTIVATIAFGMGIDKANIRRVIHADLPKSLENYSQEIGRAGRDGLPSTCTLLAGTDSVRPLENFIYGDTPVAEEIEAVLRVIPQDSSVWEVDLSALSKHSNIRQLPLKTLLIYLEKLGIIVPTASYAKRISFTMLNESIQSVIGRFTGERKVFLEELFNYAVPARTWIHLRLDEFLRGRPYSDRSRAFRAMQYFESQDWLTLRTSHQVSVYQVLAPSFHLTSIREKLADLFAEREQRELARLAHTLDFFRDRGCISQRLALYFGESLPDERGCGHCSGCRGTTRPLASIPSQPLLQSQVEEALQPYLSVIGVHDAPHNRARYLCGITFPVAQALRLTTQKGFGALEAYPFRQVHRLCEAIPTAPRDSQSPYGQ